MTVGDLPGASRGTTEAEEDTVENEFLPANPAPENPADPDPERYFDYLEPPADQNLDEYFDLSFLDVALGDDEFQESVNQAPDVNPDPQIVVNGGVEDVIDDVVQATDNPVNVNPDPNPDPEIVADAEIEIAQAVPENPADPDPERYFDYLEPPADQNLDEYFDLSFLDVALADDEFQEIVNQAPDVNPDPQIVVNGGVEDVIYDVVQATDNPVNVNPDPNPDPVPDPDPDPEIVADAEIEIAQAVPQNGGDLLARRRERQRELSRQNRLRKKAESDAKDKRIIESDAEIRSLKEQLSTKTKECEDLAAKFAALTETVISIQKQLEQVSYERDVHKFLNDAASEKYLREKHNTLRPPRSGDPEQLP